MFGRTIEEVFSAETALEIEASEKRTRLAGIEIECGDALLDHPEETDAMTDRLVRARAEITVIRSKIEASRRRRMAMVEDNRRKQAAELRSKAERAREESEAIVKRVSAQLAKIAELESVGPYDVNALQHPSEVPRHVRLLNDAEAAESKARDLEQPAKFDKAGRVTGMTARELFQKSRTDPAAMAPTLEDFERIEKETHEAALRGVPPASGFAGRGEYQQVGGWSPLAIENRGIVRHVEYRGAEIIGVTFELGPMNVQHANTPGVGLPSHYTEWSPDMIYSTDGVEVQPRPHRTPEVA